MAPTTVSVKASAAFMSFLCYEQLRVAKAQEGFLLGRVDSHVSQHISDSQICNEMTQTVITLSSFLPCTRLGIFYSGAGRLDMAKLKHYLGSHYTELVGWYRNRSSGRDTVYLRERLVHQQLTEAVTHAEGHFILAIFTSPLVAPSGTLDCAHRFLMVQNGKLEGVSLEIVNIGDTSTQDYVLTPSLTASPAVQDVAARLSGEPGVAEVEDLHQELQKKLQEVLPCLAEALREQAEVMKRVEALRRHCHQTKTAVDFCPGEEVKEGEEERKEKTTAKEATENKIDLINFQEEEEEDVEVVDKEEEVMEVDQVEEEEDVVELIEDRPVTYPPSSSSSSSTPSTPRGRGRNMGRRGRGRGRQENSPDFFSFVNVEMEKEGILARSSPHSSPPRSSPSRSSPRYSPIRSPLVKPSPSSSSSSFPRQGHNRLPASTGARGGKRRAVGGVRGLGTSHSPSPSPSSVSRRGRGSRARGGRSGRGVVDVE